MEKLVSIITPCLNGEKFVHRLLDSVLEQSYGNIEHIFVDDGSTDRTAEIIKQYIPKYEQKGKKLIYVFQENARAAAALNNGLKLFKGDYLTWPDSDDFYRSKDSIATMVNSFENLTADYGMVRCDAMLLDENTLKPLSRFSDNNTNVFKENLFDDCILERQFWYTPGCYMTSKNIVDEVIKNRDIFVNNDVQNWQMMLPILYKYKCHYINESLFNYLVRTYSISHQPKDFEKSIKSSLIHEEIIIETLKRMNMVNADLDKYLLMVERKYIKQRLNISFFHLKKKEFDHYFLKIKDNFPEEITLKLKIKKLLVKTSLISLFIRLARPILNFSKKSMI